MGNKTATFPQGPHDTQADFVGDVAINDEVPSKSDIEKASKIKVYSADGSSRPLKTLLSSFESREKVLVIFIRHFFCGLCQEYIRTLSQAIPQSSLPADTQIIVIGCGQAELISQYAKFSSSAYPVYADPSRKLYKLFGMMSTLSLGNKAPQYMHQNSMLKLSIRSIFQELASGRKIFAGGNYKQVGGEFLFQRQASSDDGERLEVTWCHRMKNTRDHVEADELRAILGASEVDEQSSIIAWQAAAGASKRKASTPGNTDLQGKRQRWSFAGPSGPQARRLSKSIDGPRFNLKRMSWAGPSASIHSSSRESSQGPEAKRSTEMPAVVEASEVAVSVPRPVAVHA